jgi:hypothetical protein
MTNEDLIIQLLNKIDIKVDRLDVRLDNIENRTIRIESIQEYHSKEGDELKKQVKKNSKYINGIASIIGFLVFVLPFGMKYLF